MRISSANCDNAPGISRYGLERFAELSAADGRTCGLDGGRNRIGTFPRKNPALVGPLRAVAAGRRKAPARSVTGGAGAGDRRAITLGGQDSREPPLPSRGSRLPRRHVDWPEREPSEDSAASAMGSGGGPPSPHALLDDAEGHRIQRLGAAESEEWAGQRHAHLLGDDGQQR